MTGTSDGGKKAMDTMKERYGEDYASQMGKRGGRGNKAVKPDESKEDEGESDESQPADVPA